MKGECMEITFESLGPGLHEGIPFADYLNIKAFSKSMVGEILKSPAHLKHRLDNSLQTKSLSLGSLVDCLVLEPETFDSTYVMAPGTYINGKDAIVKWDYRSTKCREWRDKQELSGKTVVTKDQIDEAKIVAGGITGDIAKALLSGKTQVSALWYDPLHGVPCKARYDVLNETNITDLKTSSSNATSNDFSREALKYKYHVQSAAYLESYEQIMGEPLNAFNFVVVETKAPFQVGCFALRPDSIMLGQMLWEKALGIYKECMKTGEWPGYPDVLIEIDVPAYALKPIEEGFVEDIIVDGGL
jgi:hypothetical protein